MMSNLAYLSLGSNIDPEDNLRLAVEMLTTRSKLLTVSSVWETQPVGMTGQPNFLNAAALIETKLTAAQFRREIIHRIEQALGRVRGADKYGPRTIDIDLMLFNQEIFVLEGRHIPDPEVQQRAFVAIPLAEIAPHYRHPETGQTLGEMARQFVVTQEAMRRRPDMSQGLVRFCCKT